MIRVCFRALAISLFLTANLPAQVTWGRITSYLERQPTKVFYWMVPLVAPRPAADSGEHFLAVNFRLPQSGSAGDSLLLLKTGCESLDSVVFFYVPSIRDSGLVLLLASGDTIWYHSTGALIAPDEGKVENTRATLKRLSDRLQRYSFLKARVNEYHPPVGELLGVGLFSMSSLLLLSGDGDYRALTGGLSFGTALICGFIALHRISTHDSEVKESSELESQLPPGF